MIIFVILTITFAALWVFTQTKLNGASTTIEKKESRINELANELSIEKNRSSSLSSSLEKEKARSDSLSSVLEQEKARADSLSQYQGVVDAKAEAEKIISKAETDAAIIRRDAASAQASARTKLATTKEECEIRLVNADTQASQIISTAEAKAKEIAGSAYEAMEKADEYSKIVTAMKNIISGYGDEWLKPTYSLLDELADEFGYTEAGQKLKAAREHSAMMVKNQLAAECNYAENYRKDTAIAFVTDAFNGKVDSILSKVRHDNYGKLEQKILDAFELVNYNGKAFRQARITRGYLNSRLEELKWAVVANELKRQQQEEQRELRERIREEEKARREYERAQKEAAKEEAMLKKAMEQAQKMLASANAEQKAQYEQKLQELQIKLTEAEERGRRAMSMAQQTRHGTVYIISNIGSFGENIYKVGMTRRIDPMDRVKELGDASVPFPFDVHAFIESDDAPALENELHKQLAPLQLNKVNTRKEFFSVDINTLKKLVEAKGLKVNWTMAADAAEYRESLTINRRIKSDPEEAKRWEHFIASLDASDNDDVHEADAVVMA